MEVSRSRIGSSVVEGGSSEAGQTWGIEEFTVENFLRIFTIKGWEEGRRLNDGNQRIPCFWP